jgi:hypothetical protein
MLERDGKNMNNWEYVYAKQREKLLSTEERVSFSSSISSELGTPDQTLFDTREFTTVATSSFTTLVDGLDGSKLLLLLLELLALLDTRVAHILFPVRRETLVLFNRIRDSSLAIRTHFLLFNDPAS